MDKKQKEFYLVGIGGIPNYGDEFILISWVKWIRAKYPDARIWLDTPNSAKVSEMFAILNISVNVTDYIWSISKKIDKSTSYSKNVYLNKILNILKNKYKKKEDDFYNKKFTKNLEKINYFFSKEKLIDRVFFPEIFNSIDILHVIGGGYLNTIHDINLNIFGICAALKKRYNFPVHFTGAGFLPVLPNKELVKDVIKGLDSVEARDKIGADFYGVKFGLDDAFLGVNRPFSILTDAKREIPDVLICLQCDLVDPKKFEKTIFEIEIRIKEHLKAGLSIGYIEAHAKWDYRAYSFLKDLIPEKNYFKLSDVLKFGLPLKENQLWYSSRFHHHLVASAGGAKGVILCFKPGYYDIKHNSLLEIGTGWNMYSPYNEESLPYPSIGDNYVEKVNLNILKKESQAEKIYS